MNKEKAKLIRITLQEILDANKDKLTNIGISVNLGNTSFSDVKATMKVEFTDLLSSGEVVDVREVDWNKHAEIYGLEVGWLGKVIMFNNKPFTIIGLNTHKRKKPVMIKDVYGKMYGTDCESVRLRINKE
jgi:hypothetical protein